MPPNFLSLSLINELTTLNTPPTQKKEYVLLS